VWLFGVSELTLNTSVYLHIISSDTLLLRYSNKS